ncbi:amidohydrolase family protein [Fictibacillus terranigra]|uniref:Amidohydrolase family protein n=1 Tax=Fictibacillus terranigra TaxID=3058424 RepID=A0ABT8E526_9BACL|nr:amidohydrolase family protein [Fictibacillus sp. CENA-BCM004]MDN4072991.1 amidohydrolase family protein [Fictibacillus sp. CENA-BCM004]
MYDIHEAIDRIRIIDGHEHLDMHGIRKKNKVDFFGLLHYLDSDLISAGMEREVLSRSSPISDEEKAEQFVSFWNKTKNTTYARMLKISVSDLYGMDDWSVHGILQLNEKVKAATNDDQWYTKVLKEKSGIDMVFTLVQNMNVDFSLFRPIMFLDYSFKLRTRKDIQPVEKQSGVSIHTFQHYLDAIDAIITKFAEGGMVATKLGHAYWRTLKTAKPTFFEAEQCFNRLLSSFLEEPMSQPESVVLQDYLIHHVIQCSIKNELPIQIHTGHHETSVSSSGNMITNSKVTDLLPLLAEYQDANFVLLHCGFPYHQEYLSILKNYSNAYADFTWIYILSPTIAKQLMHQMIEMVPQNKIFGFGGDYNFIEGTYAHQKLARKLVSDVLVEKVQHHMLTENEAVEFAQRIFRDNLIDFYKLKV